MRRYSTESVKRTKTLFRIFERRLIKGRKVWVCIAIATGLSNSKAIVRAMNARKVK